MSYVQAGNRISCWCGAEYEISYDDQAVHEKDDARCRFCRFVLTLWPMPFSLKLINGHAIEKKQPNLLT
jgi:hypothetical protein